MELRLHGLVACQATLSMEFSRQEYWSRLPFPSPGDLHDPGIEHASPALQVDSLLLSHQGSPEKSKFGKKTVSLFTIPIQHYAERSAAALLQSCPTLCNPTDGSPPGCSVPGILQARILQRVVISSKAAVETIQINAASWLYPEWPGCLLIAIKGIIRKEETLKDDDLNKHGCSLLRMCQALC